MSTIDSPVLTSAFDLEDRQIREIVRDLHAVKPAIFWTDLCISAGLGWAAFARAVILPPWTAGMLAAIAVAVLFLYRGLVFMHEISHQTARTLPRFETVWNFLIGYPLLIPSSAYVGVHQYHHSLGTYGTSRDPEYMPFAKSFVMTLLFAAESFLIPAILAIRYLLLSVAGLIAPPLQKWLVVHFSSLTMNLAFRRDAIPATLAKVRVQSVHILLVWSVFIGLYFAHVLTARFFVVWLLTSSLISFINTMRTLGAHGYESEGDPLDRRGQLSDSIDTPGAVWTELWAPVGLRYHALHHYFPGIPYHNLATAWSRITAALPEEAFYHRVQSRSLAFSLRALLRKGRRR